MFNIILTQYKLLSEHQNASLIRALYCYYTNANLRIRVLIYRMQSSKSNSYRWRIRNHMELKYSLIVSPYCKIGYNLHVEHFFGVVIGGNTIIGDNCKIYQQVTIGQKNSKFPVIGNNVVMCPGAKIIGDIKIGDNAVIGANAVVLHDVPANSIAVGVPARIILKNQK